MNKFSLIHKVTNNEIDTLNHVNNVHYLNWAQFIAGQHWTYLSKNKFDEKYVWVVLRHEIDYYASALLNENITITTWVLNAKGVKSDRIVEIYCEEKILAKAVTTWCLLNKKTMKPIRIPPEINAIFDFSN